MFYFLLAAALVSTVAAFYDWKTGFIPNWLTLGTLSAALVANAGYGFFRGGLAEALTALAGGLAGVVVCALVPLFMFKLGGMGGGDVKLFAAVGALCQLPYGLEAEAYGFVVALFVAPAKLAYEGTLLRTLSHSLSLVANPFRSKQAKKDVPAELMTWFRLAPAVSVGVWFVLLTSGGRP